MLVATASSSSTHDRILARTAASISTCYTEFSHMRLRADKAA